jgi:PHD/YefM family antitoxin component YafN of YafNO toxin-antitoxin module
MLYNLCMSKTLNISAARKELPSLFDRVTSRNGERVVIRRRDGDREAVLVGRDYIESLEAANRRGAAGTDFRLIGSGSALRDVEEAIAEIRSADALAAGRRQREVARRGRRACAARPR